MPVMFLKFWKGFKKICNLPYHLKSEIQFHNDNQFAVMWYSGDINYVDLKKMTPILCFKNYQ